MEKENEENIFIKAMKKMTDSKGKVAKNCLFVYAVNINKHGI